MVGQVLLGIGGSPIFTLGTTYIDNHVSEDESALYLVLLPDPGPGVSQGFMYVCVALGPVCGFLLGALMLSQYVVPPEPADLPESAFVGLWWAGFVLLGFLYLLAALPFFGFPKRLKQSGCNKIDGPPAVNITSDSVPNEGAAARDQCPAGTDASMQLQSGEAAQSPQSNCAYDPSGLTISCGAATAAAAEPGGPQVNPGVTPRSNAGNAVHFADDDQLIGADDSDEKQGGGVRTIPGHIMRLLMNHVYILSSLGACCDLAIVSGFTTYLPKYLEVQFALSKSKASLLTGSIAVPGAIVGISLGSFLLKRYKPTLSRTAAVMMGFNILALFMLAFFFFFGCANLDLVGKFKPYTRRDYGDLQDLKDLQNLLQKSTVNLSVPCNLDCHCSPDEYQPVCGRDGRTYFSPCFAGCTTVHTQSVAKPSLAGPVFRSRVNYRDCACIPENMTKPARVALGTGWAEALSTDPMGDAELGACVRDCAMMVPFFAFLFALTLCASLNQMPLIMVTLRAVTEDQKAFALGLQVVMLRVLAYIPAPIIFGAVIDTTCLLWKVPGLDEGCPVVGKPAVGTTCLLYDVEQFRLRYGLIALGLKVIAVCLSVLLWRCIYLRDRHQADAFSPPITMGELARRVADMENLHISPGQFGCLPSHAKTGPATLRTCYSDESLFAIRKRKREASASHQAPVGCGVF